MLLKKLKVVLYFKQSSTMYYFVRNDSGFNVVCEAPASGRKYPPVRVGAETVVLVDMRAAGPVHKIPSDFRTYTPSILKSNLQKCIRRRCETQAYATALQLLRQDPSELLRRLPIIMLEDTLLHPHYFPELIWLMVGVSKGYTLTAADVQIVLDSVAACLAASHRYNLSVEAPDYVDGCGSLTDVIQLCFLLRISYGGMLFDTEFMERLRQRWATGSLPVSGAELCKSVFVEPFIPTEHIIHEAIDFHCCPAILTDLSGITQDGMWWCLSAPNVRHGIGAGADAVSEKIAAMQRIHGPAMEPFLAAVRAYAERKIRSLKGTPYVAVPKQALIDGWFKPLAAAE